MFNNKHKMTMLSLALALALAGVLLLLALMSGSSPAQAAPIPDLLYVATTGNDFLNNCTSSATPCRTVQYAVDKAGTGDIIQVAAGVYTDVHKRPVPPGYLAPPAGGFITQIVYISKTIMIAGGYTTAFKDPPNPKANLTILGAKDPGRILVIAGNASPVIQGFRITSGDATGLGGGWGSRDVGGGVYIISATATLTNNWVYQNTAYDGGGLYLWYSAATLRGNTITTNTAGGMAGGGIALWVSDATLEGNVIVSNTAASHGGGLYLNYSNAALHGNIVMSNTAGHGGGLHLTWYSAATLNDNTIAANIANYQGGGAYLNYSNAKFNSNTISSNIADDGGGLCLENDSRAMLSGNRIVSNTAFHGGGLYLRDSDPTLTNTVIANNWAQHDGGGLYIAWRSSPSLWHTTIARNTSRDGSGVYVASEASSYSILAMTNTILISHTVGITVTAGNTATLEGTLWYSNTRDWGGAGAILTGARNYWGDPLFAADGYHLITDSAAINMGVSTGVIVDIDGDPRPDCVFWDIGADEVQGLPCQRTYLPVVLRN
jgi:hypothetical protein